MTDHLAYIGSANYSVESSGKYECGVIFSDPDVIEQIRDEIIGIVIENAAPQDLSEIGVAKLCIQSIGSEFKKLLKLLAEGFFAAPDDMVELKEVFLWRDAEVPKDVLLRFHEFLEQWEEAHEAYLDHPRLGEVAELIDKNIIEQCRELVEYEQSPLVRLADFSEDEATMRHFQKYAFEAYDEKVDSYMEQTVDDADQERIESIAKSKVVLNKLLEVLKNLVEKQKQILERLQLLENTIWGVDNA